jgi:predicted aspartyl protease
MILSRFQYYLMAIALFSVGMSTQALACGENGARIKSFQKVNTPFSLRQGQHMVVSAKLNGKAAVALIDTGASLTTINKATKISFLKPIGGFSGVANGGQFKGQVSLGNNVTAAGLTIDFEAVPVVDMSTIEKAMGAPVDIVIGRDVLSCKPFKIDFDRMLFSYAPALPVGQSSLPLESGAVNRALSTIISFAGAPAKMIVDTGGGGELLFTSSWANVHLKGPRHSTTTIVLGAGGLVFEELFILPRFKVGYTVTNQVETTISPDGGVAAQTGEDGIIGFNFLQRFNPVFDIAGGKMWLLPRRRAPVPLPRKTAGILGFVEGDGRFRVLHVMAGSPAKAAGWKDGEMICAVNGKPLTPANSKSWGENKPGVTTAIKMCDGTDRSLKQKYFY